MEQLEIIKELIAIYKKFPTIGSKSATRLAYATLNLSKEDRESLISAINFCNTKLKCCETCHTFYEDKCPICSDQTRDKNKILVVADSKDIYTIENTNSYNGLYFTLSGLLSPLKNQDKDKIGLSKLHSKVISEKIKEVILALPTSFEGENTSFYISHLFKDDDVIVSRIAYGIPVGTNLEYLDQLTISRSLSGRVKMEKE